MVIMMEKILWDLFKKTGEIKYYLLYQELRGQNGEDNSRRDSFK